MAGGVTAANLPHFFRNSRRSLTALLSEGSSMVYWSLSTVLAVPTSEHVRENLSGSDTSKKGVCLQQITNFGSESPNLNGIKDYCRLNRLRDFCRPEDLAHQLRTGRTSRRECTGEPTSGRSPPGPGRWRGRTRRSSDSATRARRPLVIHF